MTSDPFKIVREVQKGIEWLAKKTENSKHPNLQEIHKRLEELGEKLGREFKKKE